MTMTARLLKIAMSLTSVLVGIVIFSPRADSQPAGFGKNFDEIVKLATKEGKVNVGSGLTAEEAPLVLKGFNQKYPKIKVDLTPVSGVARGRSFSMRCWPAWSSLTSTISRRRCRLASSKAA